MSGKQDSFTELTIVVPVYKRPTQICQVLDDIASQTTLPGKVIVVDDGSTDSTVDAIANWHKHRPSFPLTILRNEHLGAPAARNAGLENVRTKWTMFFDSDDRMDAHHIETLKNTTNKNPNANLVGWDIEYIFQNGKKRTLRFATHNMQWHNLMHGSMSTQRYIAHTELFRRAGTWRHDIPYWQDIELGARLLALKPNVAKVELPSSGYFGVTVIAGPVSITGPNWRHAKDRFRPALQSIAQTLGPNHADWIKLKTAILAADIAREDSAEGLRLFRSIPNPGIHIRMAFVYRRLGGRGAARLFKPFMSAHKI